MKKIMCTLLILLSAACTQAADPAAPTSVTSKVEKNSYVSGEWNYKGKQVYTVEAVACCDIPKMVYDKDGNKICMLGGGFANQTDESCKDFQSQAKLVKKFASPKEKLKSQEPKK